MKIRAFLLAFLTAIVLVAAIDLVTNSLDTLKFTWDFKYYIGMTEHGFKADPLIGPFAYRYPTPFFASALISFFKITVEQAYKTIAYTGGILQLFSVFLIVYHFFRSRKIAYLSMLVLAFTFMNVKFLLFDIYRPDHLAYSLITLSMYFALKHRYYALLITSCIAVQFREFGILPLFSYLLYLLLQKEWRKIMAYAIPTGIALFAAVVLPRMLIPVTDTIQFVNSQSGKRSRLFKYLLSPKRNLNFLFTMAAYFLPFLMLISKERMAKLKSDLPTDQLKIVVCYICFVTFLSFLGGGDLARFMTYYFIAQIFLLGALFKYTSTTEITVMLIATFIFNRMWMQVPMNSLDQYLDFYAGFSTRVNFISFLRIGELIGFVLIGKWIRKRFAQPVFEKELSV